MYEIEILTLREYAFRMEAHNLARVDKEFDMHLQAWLNHRVTATKEKGDKQVPVYKNFKQFFDYDKRLKEVEKPKKRKLNNKHQNMARIAAQVNAGKGVG